MALEAVVFPQDSFTYGCLTKDEEDLFGIISNNLDHNILSNWDSSSPSNIKEQWNSHSSPETSTLPPSTFEATTTITAPRRRKRRHTVNAKNKEEIESQRMTHIAVERNRRKQMNEYLDILKSLMPPSYVQRGDQASIVGGAINFLKELQQHLQFMKGQKKINKEAHENSFISCSCSSQPLTEFFMFPQYSMDARQNITCYPTKHNQSRAMADIEVTLVDSHANIKIMLKKRQGQVMKMVAGIQNLGFNILHLNVSSMDDNVLVSVSAKVEEGSRLNTVDEIAAAVNELSHRIQVEAAAWT